MGREKECAVLDGLLVSAREGRSATLVIRGEAGIGKTALIDYAVGAAGDFLTVRLTGVESERELGFAALHRLLTPILHQFERLPAPQRDALSSALGLVAGPPADGFLVGLGVISLAANAARVRQRLLCVIDDAQWVDRESIQALVFWARRLNAEGIVLIFGERTGWESVSSLEGLPTLEIDGLTDDAARALLAAESGFGGDRQVADRIVTEARGNPLALVEFAKDPQPAQLIGAAVNLQPLPLSRQLEERFARQARSLPVDTQMLVLLAAADSTANTAFLLRAASVLGVKTEAAAAAEAAGLVVLGSTVAFRHPLIRSAIYGGARPADRRAAHGALAAATDSEEDSDRRAWHLAAASVGPDEEVAAFLERGAGRARERGGHNAAAALLSRSAELSPDPERAAARRIAAAEEALASGSSLQVHALIALAKPALRDPVTAARADRLDGNAWRREAKTAIAAPLLLSAAIALMPTDPRLARQTLLEAIEAVLIAGSAAGDKVISAVTEAARAAPPGDDAIVDLLLDAFGTYLAAGFVAAAPSLRVAVMAMSNPAMPADRLIRWVQFAVFATRALWDDEAHTRLTARLVQASREQGALMWLAVALKARATDEVWAGRFGAADIDLADAADVSVAAGEHRMSFEMMGLEVAAIRGRDSQTRVSASTVIQNAAELGSGSAALFAHHALLLLDLGAGEYSEALGHAVAAMTGRVGCGHQVLADVVEAAVRGGDPDRAQAAVDCLAERAPASGTPWAMGLLARCRALLAADDSERLYQEAIELLGSSRMAVEMARAHLLYGEWLRRQKRKIDARNQLRIAHNMFTDMGADAFANRARLELLATGERPRKRSVETSSDLTPQEERVARLAAAGNTNAEIASKLFISSSTVEYHLRKVFRKLSVSSRRQLIGALTPAGVTASGADGQPE
jgi:DNA-binding CsgD family transcriptional regulator